MIFCTYPWITLAVISCSLNPTLRVEPLTVNEQSIIYIVRSLSVDEMMGRSGSHKEKTRKWLESWMENAGIQRVGSSKGFRHAYGSGVNLIGMVNSAKDKQAPVVLITAHYDHVNQGRRHPGAVSEVFNGATDNAAGVAVALAVAEALLGKTAVPIAIVLFDEEEKDLNGSVSFLQKPPFSLEETKLVINLDIVGLNLARGLEMNHLVIGSESGGPHLRKDIETAASSSVLELGFLSYAFGHQRGDQTSFITANQTIPVVFFSDGDGSVYHTDADEMKNVNLEKVNGVAAVVAGLARTAAARKEAYAFAAPFFAEGFPVPIFEDVATMHRLLTELLAHEKENRLGPDHQAHLKAMLHELEGIRDGGAQAFGPQQMLGLQKAAMGLSAFSRGLPFIP